ncbi:MAG: phosphotransferase [Actinomycetota bacterium]|nr:phosphotransferase [Actinomycetota bacterium]
MAGAGDDILELIQRFFAAQPDVSSPPRIERVERVAVGRSRENWIFDAAWSSGSDSGTVQPLIVRRDPLGGLLETSRSDEFAVLRALEATAVPAPTARWLDADGAYLGRPSLVMVREPGSGGHQLRADGDHRRHRVGLLQVPRDGGHRMNKRPLGTWILYAVTAVGFAFLFTPIITIAVFTFNKPSGRFNTAWQEFTLENWGNAFKGSDYVDALFESIRVAFVASALATILGGLLAIAISRYRMKGGALINMLLILPLTTPEIVLGASLFTLFFNQGVTRGFWTVVLAHTMFCVSFVALTVKARIRGLDWSLEDAAADLGSPHYARSSRSPCP